MQMARALTHTTTPPKDNGMSMWPRQNFVVAMPQTLSLPPPTLALHLYLPHLPPRHISTGSS